jgi:hypothetical protein
MRFKTWLIRSLGGFLFLSLPFGITAQNLLSDSAIFRSALANAAAEYHHAFGSQSAIYTGSIYAGYPFAFREGHPFFYAPDAVNGSIRYDGTAYDSVSMHYDEVQDIVVINTLGNKIRLFSERVKSFRVYNNDFAWVNRDSLSLSLPVNGFYNILYNGKLSLYKKQLKSIREVITYNELQRFVDSRDLYFIRKDGLMYPVTNKKSYYNLFSERRKEVQQFVKASHLSFRNDKQALLTRATAYYDSLKK